MARKKSNSKPSKQVETLIHEDARRTNIPSAEHQSVVSEDVLETIRSPMSAETEILILS